jgi:RHS repeat-associated protein
MSPEYAGEDAGKNAASPSAMPSINLPKGGGAIRGIDEKFAANPVTGTGSLSVSIAVSPGRSGFGPQLSVAYDSGHGNGIFGMGWSLSLPSITRRMDKGIPRYYDDEESDIFILSGVEDLVPVLLQDAGGKPVLDEFVRDGHRVKRYRPRIEGLFARIERWTSLESGEEHWRSISKDNKLTVYGFDNGSRIADPANPNHIFSWLVSRSYDDKGNAILYDYAAENDAGVDCTKPSECSRARSANRYPKRILYGNRRPLLLDPDSPSFRPSHPGPQDPGVAQWMFEVVFDYGEGHYREEPPDEEGRILAHAGVEAGGDWPVRRDPFSSYRSGFEVRTYRLCRRVLMWHHFPDELGTASCLVRSTAFHYHEKPVGSFITRVVQSGHTLREDGRYLTRSLPPLDLFYSASPLEDPDFQHYRLQDVSEDSLANLPGGINGGTYRWLDLDGEGIAGVLTEQDDAWFYKPNLGNGLFGAMETVNVWPALAALSGGKQLLMDVAGDGNLDLVDLSPAAAGFQERTPNAGWENFRAFRSLPVREWSDPNLRFVDLTGDGVADVLVTEDDAFTWHPSLLKEGFGPGFRVRSPVAEGRGPRIVFADGTQSIYLADMSGDGLSDIVRIRNGEICYWPNLGYCRFGAKITMDNSPLFDTPDIFDQNRLRLADTDGTGTSDVLYLGADGVKIYLNETGNGWSKERHLRQFPGIDDADSITVTDFLGRGTACLLWSSPLPRDAGRQLRYVDLMCGQKPHLLTRRLNNLGAETRIEYASSTEFYLADKAAGTPWVTKLPFPVHVVKRVEIYDYVSRNRFVTNYTYHHGFYDGVEREFRGFGRVDQLDTEELATLTASGNFPAGDNIDAASNVPPVLTRTWFHTGVYLQGGRISRHLAHEYYQEGTGGSGEARLGIEQIQAMLLDDTILPDNLTPEEAREACRSLKSALLRQEVYAMDGTEESPRPYMVTESNYTIRNLQKRWINRHAVFFTHARESVSFHYERKLYRIDDHRRSDPRVSHDVTLEVDDYGNVLKSVAIGYGRRFPDRSHLLTDADRKQQAQILLTLTESAYTNPVQEGDAYRTPLPSESRLYELVNMRPSADLPGITNLFRFGELAGKVARVCDGRHDLTFEDWQAAGAVAKAPARRLLKQSRSVYRSNRLDRLLPPGTFESLALPGEDYKLAFTPGLLAAIYQRHAAGQPPEALLPDQIAVLGSRGPDGGGYVNLDGDGHWWTSSGRVFFHPDPHADPAIERQQAVEHFFLPRRFEDSFGQSATVDLDAHDLLIKRTVDAVGNTVSAEGDYRVLQPKLVTDPNGNRAEDAFDTLGQVAGSAVMGKVTENLGDSLAGFRADLTQAEIDQFFRDPKGLRAAALLGKATTRIVYDPSCLYRSQKADPDHPEKWQPAFAAIQARETHESDLAPGQQTKIQVGFSYSDGFGREIQKKMQAEPGPIVEGGAVSDPRWVGSGWTVFNNKGKPIRQYEPFFDDTHDSRFGNRVGVSPILCYDPVDRVVATLNPNHTWQKVVFDPWRQKTWDVNDTVLVADPGTDPDVGDFFRRLPEMDYLPTWYEDRASGALGCQEQEAARKTSIHANTPGIAYSDSLGRMVLTVAHNRYKLSNSPGSDPPTEEFYITRVLFDIEGNRHQVIDAKDRLVMRYDYDMLGTRIHQASMEAGERWMLNDVAGKPLCAWDSRNHRFRTAYDPLRRPVNSFMQEGGGADLLVGRTVYGETRPTPEANNLRGMVVQVLDQAGIAISVEYDFKGNLLLSQRRLAQRYDSTLDWSAAVPLEAETHTGRTSYDALNRPTQLIAPHSDQPGAKVNVIQPGYNESNLLEQVRAWLNQNAEPAGLLDPATSNLQAVSNIDYNAKGQRTRVEYGNGVSTTCAYDPLTFRLMLLLTKRDAVAFPGDCPRPAPAGWPGCQVQNLHYTYDPFGNITHIRDDAQQTVFFRNRRVEPSTGYTYDAIYRLIEATGREHLGQAGGSPVPYSYNDDPRVGLPGPGDGNAMGTYLERYVYDAVGNFLSMQHRGSDPLNQGWRRDYAYNEPSLLEPGRQSNRLTATTVGATTETYSTGGNGYDAHGNMLRMPQLQIMQWDFKDQLQMIRRQAVNAADADGERRQGERTWYVYDSTGQRMRKVTELATGQIKEERVYLGIFEIYRKSGAEPLVRETLHIMDDKQRIALVETRIRGNEPGVPQQLIRYQFGNHLDSVSLELDDQAHIVSYEEYTPCGSTSYQAVRSRTETPKRYRYTGKERDEESGLYYYGARYYAAWLGRWTSCDPIGIGDSINLFVHAKNRPITLKDVGGLWSSKKVFLIFSKISFDPVHQMAIENVLKGKVDQHSLDILIKQQHEMDKPENQRPEDQPKHAMTGEGMKKQEAIKNANDYVHEQIGLARAEAAAAAKLQPGIDSLRAQLKAQIEQSEKGGDNSKSSVEKINGLTNRFLRLTSEQRGHQDKAMVHLGNAIHVLQDATSPAHELFQTFHDYSVGPPLFGKGSIIEKITAVLFLPLKLVVGLFSMFSALIHIFQENKYPKSGTEERDRLEGATLWGYEMYKSGNIPEKIFDEKSGAINIPQKSIANFWPKVIGHTSCQGDYCYP